MTTINAEHALTTATELQGGAFILQRVLGEGGFGITYQAHETHLNRPVAIKEFFPGGCERVGQQVQFPADMNEREQHDAKRNFLNEARILAKLRHPHIVSVYGTFEENNSAYMVMEFLEGQTLEAMVQAAKGGSRSAKAKGALPEQEAIAYIEQVGEALRLVHNTHLIHRDVKPENIVACRDGRVVLLDFGLNKELGDPASYGTMRLTEAIRFGSPGYSPPEQYGKQNRFGPYTDIYALGATLYYLLTGEVPTESPERMYGESLATVRDLNPRVSQQVNDAVMWALELRGDQRPQTVQDFLKALQPSQAAQPTTAKAQLVAPRIASAIAQFSSSPVTTTAPTYAPAPLVARSAQKAASVPAAPGNPVLPNPPTPKLPVPVVVANAPSRLYLHFKSGLLEVLPRLMIIVALLGLAIFFAKSQQHTTKNPHPHKTRTVASAKAHIKN